nr:MAG TPA: hypothetical protein [Caudoviricetes sp.]
MPFLLLSKNLHKKTAISSSFYHLENYEYWLVVLNHDISIPLKTRGKIQRIIQKHFTILPPTNKV